MKTAEEFKNDWLNGFELDINQINDLMIEFAKYHVKKALEQASENAESYVIGGLTSEVDKDSILNAYPLDLIK